MLRILLKRSTKNQFESFRTRLFNAQTSVVCKCFSSQAPPQQNEEPARAYLGSAASTWKAEYSRTGRTEPMLWYQPIVIIFSLSMFLLYFCVFREENDIDEHLRRPISDTIPGFEKQQILMAYHYNKDHGIDVTALEKRLREIEEEEKNAATQAS